MGRFKGMILCAVTLAATALPSTAYARASCWCRLGSPSSPYKDFGAIETWGGQSGHDSTCSDLCSQTVTSWMANPSNYSTVCQKANWGSLAAYSSVGTRAWIAAWTTTCNSPNKPASGALGFTGVTTTTDLSIKINDDYVVVNNNTQPIKHITDAHDFTTFVLVVPLGIHLQSWTFTSQLYRDNVLVEVFSKKTPIASGNYAITTFTQQPNSFVHGHVWKIVWTYHNKNGASSYTIP